MPALDFTGYDAMFKEFYPDGVGEEVAYRKHALLQLLTKKDEFEGDAYVVPIITSGPTGRSASLSKAITNASGATYKKFVILPGASNQDYVAWKVQTRVILASRSNRGAFASARKKEGDLALKQIGASLAHALYGDGSGALGVVSVLPGGNVITLSVARDTRFFYVGQVLQADDTADGSSPRAGSMTVTAVDEDAGQITCGGGLIAGLAVNDTLFQDGDPASKLKGLAAWIPLASPGATLFWNVNRSLEPTKLAGSRLNTPGAGVFENVLQMCELVSERGGEPSHIMLSNPKFNELARATEATVERAQGGKGVYGFKTFEFQYSGGSAMVVADPDCPSNRGYVLTLDSWWITHLEALPHIVRDGGVDSIRGATSDDIEMRARYYAELVCEAPAWNGVCAL